MNEKLYSMELHLFTYFLLDFIEQISIKNNIFSKKYI